MGKEKELNWIKSLPLEEKAKQDKVRLSGTVMFIIFLCGFIPGLYYWFGNSFIFEYYVVTPFFGFVLFVLAGILVAKITNYCYILYWKEYNDEIIVSQELISEKIKNGYGTSEELFRMKKDHIERKIGRELLTDDDFKWHSSHFCWGCGGKHQVTPKLYTITKERTHSYKDGAYRRTQIIKRTYNILLCPSCYDRLSKSDRISMKNMDVGTKVLFILYAVIAVTLFIIGCIADFNENESFSFSSILYGLLFAFIGLAMSASLGRIILIPLAGLISLPFMKEGDSKTKWDFNEIPEIKKFMNKDFRH